MMLMSDDESSSLFVVHGVDFVFVTLLMTDSVVLIERVEVLGFGVVGFVIVV